MARVTANPLAPRPKASVAGLLLIGAGPRLLVGAGIVVALWLGFFWATSAPGAW